MYKCTQKLLPSNRSSLGYILFVYYVCHLQCFLMDIIMNEQNKKVKEYTHSGPLAIMAQIRFMSLIKVGSL